MTAFDPTDLKHVVVDANKVRRDTDASFNEIRTYAMGEQQERDYSLCIAKMAGRYNFDNKALFDSLALIDGKEPQDRVVMNGSNARIIRVKAPAEMETEDGWLTNLEEDYVMGVKVAHRLFRVFDHKPQLQVDTRFLANGSTITEKFSTKNTVYRRDTKSDATLNSQHFATESGEKILETDVIFGEKQNFQTRHMYDNNQLYARYQQVQNKTDGTFHFVDTRFHFAREFIENGKVTSAWSPTYGAINQDELDLFAHENGGDLVTKQRKKQAYEALPFLKKIEHQIGRFVAHTM